MPDYQRPVKRPSDWHGYMHRCAEAARDPRLRRYFRAWNLDGDTPISQAPLAAMDMETTGLDPHRHAIISIGLVPFTLGRVHFSQRRHWLVKPPRPLEAASVTLHHITHSDLAGAPDLGDILDELLEAMAGRLMVVHYRNIERPFLNAAVQARLGEGLMFPVIDTMELEARFHRQSVRARLRHWIGGAPASLRLQESRQRYGLPAYQPHHAAVDALATAELLQAQIQHRYGPESPVGELWG
ncbi:MAG: 3'-5' exonuclease [Ectothiorhodospiraceae bacterium]|nr:3'-5' exonuclease [Ectothiorhodospiraceae bacterium]